MDLEAFFRGYLLIYSLVVMGTRSFLLRQWVQSRREKANKLDIRMFADTHGIPFVSFAVLVGIGLMMAFLLYFFDLPWMTWAQLSVSEWVRWGGVLLGLVSLPLHVWVHWTLGKGLAHRQLVTTGPYRKIRHSMFIVTGIVLCSMSLVAADFLLLTSVGGFILLMILWAPREEEMLLDEFGEQYREYMMRTWKFFPLGKKKQTEND